jgi:hypothetical protein
MRCLQGGWGWGLAIDSENYWCEFYDKTVVELAKSLRTRQGQGLRGALSFRGTPVPKVPPDLATGFSQRRLHRSQPEPGGAIGGAEVMIPWCQWVRGSSQAMSVLFPPLGWGLAAWKGIPMCSRSLKNPLIHFHWFNMLLKLPWLLQPLLWLILVYAGQRTTSSIFAD